MTWHLYISEIKKNTCRVDHLYEEFWFVFHFNNERMNKMKKFALPNDEKK